MFQDTAIDQPAQLTLFRINPAATASKASLACSSCRRRDVCLPCDLDSRDLDRFEEIAAAKRRVGRSASLYHGGDAFLSLYAIRSGAFKTVCVSRRGDEKVTGFHLAGEMLGLEAINAGRYGYSAIALEDSEVCAIRFAALEKMALAMPTLQHRLHRVLSSDISRDHGLMLLLGRMSAEQRLAAFLLSLSRRYQRLGFAADRFTLQMSREDIGSYLGVTTETVSRLFSRFHRENRIGVQQRQIEMRNAGSLRDLVGQW